MTKKESEMKRELAKLYYMQGLPQKEIAQRVDVSETTISAWCRKENWEEMRAAKTVSRQEVVAKMLRKVSERLDDENWTPDELAKISASIEKLDKKTNVRIQRLAPDTHEVRCGTVAGACKNHDQIPGFVYRREVQQDND